MIGWILHEASLGLELKVKSFKIFTTIHNYKILFTAKIYLSINNQFLTASFTQFNSFFSRISPQVMLKDYPYCQKPLLALFHIPF